MHFQYMPEIYALAAAENHFVAERVASWLHVHDQYQRWDDIAECSLTSHSVFTGSRSSVWLTDDQANYLALTHLEAPTGQSVVREPGEAEKLAYKITQVIIHARSQFRAYLPVVNQR